MLLWAAVPDLPVVMYNACTALPEIQNILHFHTQVAPRISGERRAPAHL